MVARSGHRDPKHLPGDRNRGRAIDRLRLRSQTSVDMSRDRRVGDRFGLRYGSRGEVGCSRDLLVLAGGRGGGPSVLGAGGSASAGSRGVVVVGVVDELLGLEIVLVDVDASREHR
jgi:hypothetical protein